eukprot:558901-Pyramimonas_sp.AAC.1
MNELTEDPLSSEDGGQAAAKNIEKIARVRVLFRGLEKRATLPAGLTGCAFVLGPKLRDAARDAVEDWTERACDFDLARELRNLERPLPSGKGGHRIHFT